MIVLLTFIHDAPLTDHVAAGGEASAALLRALESFLVPLDTAPTLIQLEQSLPRPLLSSAYAAWVGVLLEAVPALPAVLLAALRSSAGPLRPMPRPPQWLAPGTPLHSWLAAALGALIAQWNELSQGPRHQPPPRLLRSTVALLEILTEARLLVHPGALLPALLARHATAAEGVRLLVAAWQAAFPTGGEPETPGQPQPAGAAPRLAAAMQGLLRQALGQPHHHHLQQPRQQQQQQGGRGAEDQDEVEDRWHRLLADEAVGMLGLLLATP
ncbi:hypothetical protein PAPYR_9150 [Paratrimastix pyriformis]|uniref:Uncharacterized protein n=1 Tax=Paratrimastix pyriformis TaxID=342808 RepID=A0ABQ8UD45_9EUKA|nr:hypothetical protein PAPYR_9150 [Paratrimastix pyriformis]